VKNPSSFFSVIKTDGYAYYGDKFFDRSESDRLLAALITEVPWSQDAIKMFGKSVLQPRLTCWMGDSGAAYKYSGLLMQPRSWSPIVNQVKVRVEEMLELSFNGALLNYYRDGMDSMGWHRDNEKELGHQPTIASVSFGAERSFEFRRYKTKADKTRLQLGHGSVLVMGGDLQEFWEHSLPKAAKLKSANLGPRVNITFRKVAIS
jgi:alkylated DNA repair dioxygenase AlkB